MKRTLAELITLLRNDPGKLTPTELRFVRAEMARQGKPAKAVPKKPARVRRGARKVRTLLEAAWKQHEAADADIRANGLVHVTDKGYRYANPAVNQRKEAAAMIAKLQELVDAAEKKTAAPAGVVARKR